jgi:hypothetical protein
MNVSQWAGSKQGHRQLVGVYTLAAVPAQANLHLAQGFFQLSVVVGQCGDFALQGCNPALQVRHDIRVSSRSTLVDILEH